MRKQSSAHLNDLMAAEGEDLSTGGHEGSVVASGGNLSHVRFDVNTTGNSPAEKSNIDVNITQGVNTLCWRLPDPVVHAGCCQT